MKVYIVIGEYERSMMSEIFGAFDSREKAVNYIQSNFDNVEYNEYCETWSAEVFHDNVELRINWQEVQ